MSLVEGTGKEVRIIVPVWDRVMEEFSGWGQLEATKEHPTDYAIPGRNRVV
jgi:hypothetical protein